MAGIHKMLHCCQPTWVVVSARKSNHRFNSEDELAKSLIGNNKKVFSYQHGYCYYYFDINEPGKYHTFITFDLIDTSNVMFFLVLSNGP